MDLYYIQKPKEYWTGVVHVIINEKGNTSYDIHYPSAWYKKGINDKIIQKVSHADAFIF